MEYREIGTKNLRYLWSVLANSSTLDSETNGLSIINLVEQVTINIGKDDVERRKKDQTSGYAIPVQLHLVTRVMKRNPAELISFQIRIELLNPESKVLNSIGPTNVEMKPGMRNMRIRGPLPPLLVDKKGEYTFRVLMKESNDADYTEVDRVPLDVDLVEATLVVPASPSH